MIYIEGASILSPDPKPDGYAVLVDGGRIAAVAPAASLAAPPGARRIEAAGLTLVPGFTDMQLNGGFGHDFTADPSTIWTVAAELPRYGVTSFLPTVISSPPATLAAARRVLAAGPPAGWRGAAPLGLHVEGPFLNPRQAGAHNRAHLRLPDLDTVADWSPENGVRMVTLAPELPGALPVAAALAERGVLVAAGHSMATWAEAHAAFDAGVRFGTHLYNAMAPLDRREPGIVGALLVRRDIAAGLIVDGTHVHPMMIDLAWRTKSSQGCVLVTDAMAALGMPPGEYVLGDQTVVVRGRQCRLADGTLAGSVLTFDEALRNLMEFAYCAPQRALTSVTANPARLLGLTDRGRVAPGFIADLVLLNRDWEIAMTLVQGEIAGETPSPERSGP